jgi:hypothetical protein
MAELMEELDKISSIISNNDPNNNAINNEGDDFPTSYSSNCDKELYMLECCENFQRQYSHLYGDRKPLFLTPKNECGVEKFICTTIRPTLLKYPELNNYDGCAEFVADYLNFQPLDSPIDLPLALVSPTTV